MDKTYIHNDFEKQVYRLWEKSGGFSPKNDPDVQSFTIIMPPPNANDPLHVGHAMFVAVEDILVRFHRMKGEAVLWLPGTDHAGIETQFVFEKKLAKEGKSRFDFDRTTLYSKIVEYVEENSKTAIAQMKRLGASADWSRNRYTLDQKIQELVVETFEKLNQDGLVYRDLRLVNYCTKCGTSFSELEAVHVEQNDPLYYIKYGPFTLATVRPETKFGDTALAVNPNDGRYQKWVSREVEVEGLLGKFKIKVIADEYVDPKFGTGVVKITPAHDPNDFEVWQRHRSEIPEPIQVIGFNGKLTERAGDYRGLSVLAARKQVVDDLYKAGLMVKVDEDYVHNVGTCYRCGRTLEPLPLPQFYIKVKPLTEKALKALDEKRVKVYGAGYSKILRHWLENLKDWNISRQIVWGIRLPVWYRVKHKTQEVGDRNAEIVVVFVDREGKRQHGQVGELLKKYDLMEIKEGLQDLRAPMGLEYVVSPTSPGEDYIQETDTFDTWFSSGQWPFVTLLSQNETSMPERNTSNPRKSDFNRFYPTQVMETAYDILMFWVMRMMMLGIYRTGEVPFEKVYLHGLIRDERGQKMSKSKGNVIDPITVVEKYGADALRMALVIRSTPGIDKNVGENDIRAMRNLTNKIWNAARYVVLLTEENKLSGGNEGSIKNRKEVGIDSEFYKKLDDVVGEVTGQLDGLRVGLAAETVYNEFWHWYCDRVIEDNKKGRIDNTSLFDGLVVFLKLLHPFVPFVTEAVWDGLRKRGLVPGDEVLMLADWPSVRHNNTKK